MFEVGDWDAKISEWIDALKWWDGLSKAQQSEYQRRFGFTGSESRVIHYCYMKWHNGEDDVA